MAPRKTVGKPPVEPEETPEITVEETTEYLDPDPLELFDLAGAVDNAKIDISRLNERTGNYAMLAKLAAPCDWEQVARRFGGGSYRWVGKVAGRFHSSGSFEVDTAGYPTRGQPNTGFGLHEPPERGSMESILDRLMTRMERLEAGLASPPSQVAPPQSTVKDTIEMLALLQQSQTGGGAGEVLKILQSGIDIGSKAGGDGKESGLASVAEAVLPKILELIGSRNSQMFERDKARGFSGPRRVKPKPQARKEKEPDSLIVNVRKLVGMAVNGVDPAEAAAFAEEWLPPAILDMLLQLEPADLLRQIKSYVPAQAAFLDSPTALEWARQFIECMTEEEVDVQTVNRPHVVKTVDAERVDNAEGNTVETGAGDEPSPTPIS